jgi:very-short-patch-repair endonuclease
MALCILEVSLRRTYASDTQGYLVMRGLAREMRREDTPAEAQVWEVVRDRRVGGHRFLRQRIIDQYILDFYCPALKLALEIDGDVHKKQEVAEKDNARSEALKEARNIRTLRWHNDDVLNATVEELQARLLAQIEDLPPLSS